MRLDTDIAGALRHKRERDALLRRERPEFIMNPYVYGGGGGGGGTPGDGVFTFSNAWLLMHGNSVSPVLDTSTYQQGVANSGATLNTTVKPYGTGSLQVGGTTTRIRVGHRDGSWALGTNNFFFCTQFRKTSAATGTKVIASAQPADSTGGWLVYLSSSSNVVRFYNGTSEWMSTSALSDDTDYEILIGYDGTTLRFFIDGNLDASHTVALGSIPGHAVLGIGNYPNVNNNAGTFYIKDVLLVVGESGPTSNYARRTTEWTDTGLGRQTVATPTGSNIKLLLHFDGNFTDSSTANTKTVTANGGATTTSAQFVFGTESSVYDGAGDYLTTPDSADWDLGTGGVGTGDYTIMMWVRPDTTGASETFISCYTNSATGWVLQKLSNNTIAWNETGDGFDAQGTSVLSSATWYNVCASRKNGVLYIFVDGICEDVRVSTQNTQCAGTLFIGRLNNTFPSEDYDGYIDELIVVKGEAIVHGSYTVPTSAFANP